MDGIVAISNSDTKLAMLTFCLKNKNQSFYYFYHCKKCLKKLL